MVGSKCILEFLPSDNMIGWEHGEIVIPPKARGTAKLLRGKKRPYLRQTWHHK
jgi:predicted metalloenzyme YecM